MTDTTFASLGLAEPLLRALETEGYTTPTPIQARSIPHLLDSRDLLGLAQTGTGKTAAFVLPMLQHLAAAGRPAGKRPVRALILAPTRELAVQIGDSIAAYGRHMDLRHTVILGGVGAGSQIAALERGIDIVVATPGRLLDHAQSGHMKFDQIVHFVLDEADRMFDMGFIRDVRKIISRLPKKRQTMLFSATMPTDIAALAAEILVKPERVEVTPKVVTVERIEQQVYFVDQNAKRALLDKLLADPAYSRVIVFTRTKHRANRVSEQIHRAGIPSDALHGNKSQNARQRALDMFKAGKVRVLVATDIAARGIDVDGVTHVINFELPNEPESYVHRIGRTARAGAGGIAVSFCDASERAYLKSIERLTRKTLTVLQPGPLPKPEPLSDDRRSEGRGERRGHGGGHGNGHGGRGNGGRGAGGRSGGQRGRSAPRERENDAHEIWTNNGSDERVFTAPSSRNAPAGRSGERRANGHGGERGPDRRPERTGAPQGERRPHGNADRRDDHRGRGPGASAPGRSQGQPGNGGPVRYGNSGGAAAPARGPAQGQRTPHGHSQSNGQGRPAGHGAGQSAGQGRDDRGGRHQSRPRHPGNGRSFA